QLRQGPPVLLAENAPDRRTGAVPTEIIVPGGAFLMGTTTEPWALDNERPAHEMWVDEFAIDTFPVTNVEYFSFLDAGGYQDRRWWSAAGWDYRCRHDIEA